MIRLRYPLLLLLCTTALAEGPAVKPQENRPQPPGDVKPADPKPIDPKRAAEEAAHAIYSRQVDASGVADLARAAFEKQSKAGRARNTPETQAAFQGVVTAYRSAIDIDPGSDKANYCRQGLSGAFTYVGDFEGAARILTEAINIANTPKQRLHTSHSLFLHYIQAMHKPAEARQMLEMMQPLVDRIEDENEMAKWRGVIQQAQEMVVREEAKKKQLRADDAQRIILYFALQHRSNRAGRRSRCLP